MVKRRSRSKSSSRSKKRKSESKKSSSKGGRSRKHRSKSRSSSRHRDRDYEARRREKRQNKKDKSKLKRSSSRSSIESSDRSRQQSRSSSKSKKLSKLPTKPGVSASDRLKQDVLSILKKTENQNRTDSSDEDVKPSVAAINSINTNSFKQQAFKSTNNKPKTSLSVKNAPELSALNPTLAALNSGRYRKKKDMPELSVFNDNLFIDEDEKLDLWMTKLKEYRRKFISIRKPIEDDLFI